MANSLRDQLLQAGLITAEQAEKASQPKPKQNIKPKNKAHGKPQAKPAKPNKNKENPPPRKEPSDLAQFYDARAQAERDERQQEEQRKREIAARRKKTREQIATLVSENLRNVDDAEIRYNFVVGDNIKYLYVTEQQQQALADGILAITFQAGKRCLIPIEVARQIMELDPDKIMVINTQEAG